MRGEEKRIHRCGEEEMLELREMQREEIQIAK